MPDEENNDSVVRLLDDNTANQIAAGEVVERPSSVVKELVENSLDAGASRIEVELFEGGKNKIVVRDNGAGMSRADAVLALQRHATSKIRSADDLFSIHTLGFRGEALPSIASVSDFRILTKRPQDETGTEIIVRAGELADVRDAAAPDGTQITVENLFFCVPARLKFLKTTQTELNHATDFLHRLILAYHTIGFRLTHDSHELIAYPGSADPRQALATVYGRDVAREMVPLLYESPGLTVRGSVSKPSVSKATRSAQAFFVNGRHVRSRTVQHAFDAAFSRLMTTERHPVVALFVEISPELVDVNVHPAKTEVRFTRDGEVYAAISRAVESALLTGGLVPEVTVQASLPELSQPTTLTMPGMGERGSERLAPPLRTSLSNYVNLESALASEPTPVSFVPPSNDPGGFEQPSAYIGFDGYRIGRLRVLGQSRNTYIIAETDDALLLIDQHIAHERVLYEQMMNGATDSAWGVVTQHLAVPQTLDLSPADARVVQERLGALERSGFILEPFGGETFMVRAVPARVADKPYLEILKEIIEELTQTSVARRLLVAHESAIIMASCKMAVKKGDPLTMDEMTRLLADLAQMRNPFTCPHGRPILLALSHHEMDRKFHRIGPH
ncbi:DNA mismatch repair endonuclease MutL [Armatimonas sp.]|uniref:DNA mismatch repair endonuclease MutL n=1 Tax=Armatimonas sp. TaxID=1872638 RepID=UPI00375064E5